MSLAGNAVQAYVVEPNQAWQKAVGQKETVAALAQLPQGLVLDDTVDEPIWYNAARKLVCYRGFMCNASYVLLRRLSDQPEYIAALEHLYLGSAEDAPAGSRLLWRLAAPLTVAATVAGGLWIWLH